MRFAHPAEAVIAGLLDSYGVRWLYEPMTFPLVTSASGQPMQCFTPDFFLPDYSTYIEMTTMRQSLVTRKNRKFRLMRELYPDVDVRLLYRKDVELIMDRYDAATGTRDERTGNIVASAEQVRRKAEEAAAQLAREGDQPVALVALDASAEPFRNLIADALERGGQTAVSLRVTVNRSLKPGAGQGAAIRLIGSSDLAGYRRVLVADVVGTGLTASAALRWFAEAGMPVADVVALLDRRSARLIEVPLLVPALPAPSAWVVGAGIGCGSAGDPEVRVVAASAAPISQSHA